MSTAVHAEVTRLAIAPIKAMRLLDVDEISLDRRGARGDRRFYIVNEQDRMVNAKRLPPLLGIVPTVTDDWMSLAFPDGRVVEGPISLGEPRLARFNRREDQVRDLLGPFAEAVSEWVSQPVSIVQAPVGGADRGKQGGASIVSRASLARFAEAAGSGVADGTRFRMLIEIDGVPAHAEDRWVGRRVRVGDAVVRVRGHVGRCLVTGLDPVNGEKDMPTLEVLREYRNEEESTEPLPFGIYGEIVTEGTVRRGDSLTLADEEGSG